MRGVQVRALFTLGALVFASIAIAMPADAKSTTWTVVPSANPNSTDADLNGVSCARPRTCVAVGSYFDFVNYRFETLAETWDGSRWAIVASPSPSTIEHCLLCTTGIYENVLRGASCATPTFCVAVGSYEDTPDRFRTLIEIWNGITWTLSPGVNANVDDAELNSVSCSTPHSCVAVGDYFDGELRSTGSRTLAETWDGHTWTLTPTANPGGFSNVLNAVSCPTARACVAVGIYGGLYGPLEPPLVERWDGNTWTRVPSPDPNTGHGWSSLGGVSCPTAKSCVAVGTYFDERVQRTLTEIWDGNTWTLVPSPNTDTDYGGENHLLGVSCVTARSCVAVGFAAPTGSFGTLLETWDGTSWRLATTPGGENHLFGVSCATPNSCIAVGSTYSFPVGIQPLVLSGAAP